MSKCLGQINHEVLVEIFNEVAEKYEPKKKLSAAAKTAKFKEFSTLSKENTLKDLFSSDSTVRRKTLKTLIEKVKDSLVIATKTVSALNTKSDFYVDMPETFRKGLEEFAVDSGNEEVKIGTAQALTALHIVKDALKTETDLYNKYNVPLEYQERLKGTTSATRLYAVIGRAMLLSNGYKVTSSSELANTKHATLGKEILENLEKAGFLEIRKGEPVVATGTVKSNGNFADKLVEPGVKVIADGTVIQLDKKFDEHITEYGSEFSQLQKLIMPIAIKLPLTEKNSAVFAWNLSPEASQLLEAGELKDKLKAVYTELQSRGYKINSDLVNYLKAVKSTMVKDNLTFKQVLAADTGNYKVLKAVFGYDLFKAGELDIYRDSVDGKELSKIAPLQDLIDNIETFDDTEIYARLFLARNGRTHTYDSILNTQSDKFMARWIMQPSVKATYEGADKELLTKDIAIHLGIPTKVVTGEVKNHPFETLYATYTGNLAKNLSMDRRLTEFKIGMNKAGLKEKDFWKVFTTLEAVKAVRESKDGPVETNFTTEVDATASGALIKILYAMGNPNADNIITKFLSGEYKDAYEIGQRKITEMLKILDEDTAETTDEHTRFYKAQQLNSLMELLAKSQGITYDPKDQKSFNKSTRELLKYAIMTYLYGQSAANNKKQVGSAFADELIKMGADLQSIIDVVKNLRKSGEDIDEVVIAKIDALTDAIGTTKVLTNRVPEHKQKDIRQKFVEFIEVTVGETLAVDVLKKEYTDNIFEGYESNVDKLYEVLEENLSDHPEKSFNDLQIEGPLQNIVDGVTGTAKIKLSKLKETLVKVAGVGDTIALREHQNPISAKVIPIHATDSAVLLRTVSKFLEYTKTKEGLQFLAARGISEDIAKNSPLTLVHDAVIADPRIARLVAELYEESLIEVTYQYDPREALLKAAQELGPVEESLVKETEAAVAAKKASMEELFNIVDGKVGRSILYSFQTDYDKELKSLPSTNERRLNIAETSTEELMSKVEEEVDMTTPFDMDTEILGTQKNETAIAAGVNTAAVINKEGCK